MLPGHSTCCPQRDIARAHGVELLWSLTMCGDTQDEIVMPQNAWKTLLYGILL